jgi:hypothetical protein
MAEIIDDATGLFTIARFAQKSTLSLHKLLKSIQNAPLSIRNLEAELDAVSSILRSLLETISNDDNAFTTLKNPIFRCGQACSEFEALVNKIVADRSQVSSFKPWTKLIYMGENITGFKDMIACYRAVFSIAIGDANM